MFRSRFVPLFTCLFGLSMMAPSLAEAEIVAFQSGATPVSTAESTPNYTSPDVSITLSIPDGWQADSRAVDGDLFSVMIGSVESALDKDPFLNLSRLDPGEASVHMLVGSPAAMIGELVGIEDSDDPLVFLPSFVQKLNGLLRYDFTDAAALNVRELPAARMDFDGKARGQGFIVAIRLEADRLAFVVVSAAAGELPDWETGAQAIIDSLTYKARGEIAASPALDLTQHFISRDSRLAFDYPATWLIGVADSSSDSLDLSIASSGQALHKDPLTRSTDKFAPDQIRFAVFSGAKASLARTSGVTASAGAADFLAGILKRQPNPDEVVFAGVEAATVDDYPAARATFSAPGLADGSLLLIDFGNGIVGVIAVYFAPGEADRWTATVDAMLETLSYTP